RHRKAIWKVLCICGRTVEVLGSNLRQGRSISCGCLGRELLGRRSRTHGRSRTSEYAIYMTAKGRCKNPANKDFSDYGGRGIEFRFTSFEGFIDHIGLKPSPD